MIGRFLDSLKRALEERRNTPAPGIVKEVLATCAVLGVLLFTFLWFGFDRQFREDGALTIASSIFLGTAGVLSFLVFWKCRDDKGLGHWFWLCGSLGFIFFAIDEKLEFHEAWADWLLQPTLGGPGGFRNWNDPIVMAYGVIAIVVLVLFLPEVLRFPWFAELTAVGFGFYALHTAIDSFVQGKGAVKTICEESSKLGAGAFFALAMWMALSVARSRTGSTSPQS